MINMKIYPQSKFLQKYTKMASGGNQKTKNKYFFLVADRIRHSLSAPMLMRFKNFFFHLIRNPVLLILAAVIFPLGLK